ncbi:MAG: aromatic ring-hydroxylating dioxygenase subunit alpha [Actinomycetota bacterium]
MERPEQIRLLQSLIKRLDTDTNVDAGGFRRNPTSSYVDADLAAAERRQFFHAEPQVLGLSGDLPEPGSFLTFDDLDVPVLATRDADGRFRAFVNSCRHRGVVLESRPRGSARRFVCEFHNWTYDTAGTLVGLPKQEHFGSVDQSCLGLVELPAEERHGILWAVLDPEGSIDLDEALGPELSAELESWGFGSLLRLGFDRYDVACNWKLAMDTFGETYHFSALHSDSLFGVFHGNVQCYDTFGRNHRMILCRRAIDEMRHWPEDQWQITVGALPVYWLFPNVQLLPNQNGMYIVRAFPHPDDPGRHVSQIDFYIHPHRANEEDTVELFRAVSQGFAEIIRDEDYKASASQQRSASSGALPEVLFGRNEPALHHYHNTYRHELGLEPLPLLASVDS